MLPYWMFLPSRCGIKLNNMNKHDKLGKRGFFLLKEMWRSNFQVPLIDKDTRSVSLLQKIK